MPADPSLVEASDGLATAMVLLIGFALGMILTILLVMARNSGKKPDVLPEDEEDGQAPQPQSQLGKKDQGATWERDADWWKDGDGEN